jgi:hypothetical protein
MVECEHEIDPVINVCTKCYYTAAEIFAGRNRDATWEDVDKAYQDGRTMGILLGRLLYKKERRKKLVEVGYYLCLRDLGKRKGVQ